MTKPNSTDWKLVYTTSTEYEAYLIKGMLENEEIEVRLLSQIDTTRQFTMGGLAIAKLYVRERNFDVAKRLITEKEK